VAINPPIATASDTFPSDVAVVTFITSPLSHSESVQIFTPDLVQRFKDRFGKKLARFESSQNVKMSAG
jgi:hypothetical protein